MFEATSIIEGLESRLTNGTSEQRAEIMRRVTDLFLTVPASLTAEQIFLFDDVIQKLTSYLEHQVLAELALRIVTASNVPPELLRSYAARDSIEFAGPILARSDRLSDQTLIEIAERKSQLHLAKIAERRHLSETVTDALVEYGDRDVLSKVAANYGARFSRLGMSTLVMRADGDDELISIIAQRSDIPTTVYIQLLGYATEQTRRHLVYLAPRNSGAAKDILTKISARAGATITERGVAAAQRFVQIYAQDIEQTKRDIPRFVEGDRVIELIAALSVVSAIPVDLIDRLVCDENCFGLVVLCKAVDFDWSVTKDVLNAGPSASGRRSKLEEIRRDFERLSKLSARRILGHWCSRLSSSAA